MPGMTTTRLPYTDYYLTIKRDRNSLSDKGNGKTVIVSYTTLNHVSKSGKVSTTVVGNTWSN